MQSSIGDHKNFDLDSEFNGEPVRRGQDFWTTCKIKSEYDALIDISISVGDTKNN